MRKKQSRMKLLIEVVDFCWIKVTLKFSITTCLLIFLWPKVLVIQDPQAKEARLGWALKEFRLKREEKFRDLGLQKDIVVIINLPWTRGRRLIYLPANRTILPTKYQLAISQHQLNWFLCYKALSHS